MIFFLCCWGTILSESVGLGIYMITIIEAVVTEVVTDCCHDTSKLFESIHLKLNSHGVRSSLQNDVGHLGDIEAVHIVVIAYIVVTVLVPKRF